MKRIFFLFFVTLIFNSFAYAEAPVMLEGLIMIKQWTDYENKSGEMPDFIWGRHEGADRVGIHIEFADGSSGSATYRGITKTDIWNKATGINLPGIPPDTKTGFFEKDPTSPLHFLRNVPRGCNSPAGVTNCLPMAWSTLTMPYAKNFDLDHRHIRGSHFRATTTGWKSVVITIYSIAAYVQKEVIR